jgi:hypothetical protein
MRPSVLCNLSLLSVVALMAGSTALSAQTIRGRVEDAASRTGVSVVELTLLTGNGRVLGRTQSDSVGAFQLNWRSRDMVRLRAERLGFQPTTTSAFQVGADEVITATLLLSVQPITVEPLIIAGRTRADDMSNILAAIERRRKVGIGHFIMREQIRAMGASELSQVLRLVPGVTVRVDEKNGSAYAVSNISVGTALRRSGNAICPMTIFLDGRIHRNPIAGVNVLAPWEIEAIEVFRGFSEMPAEYAGAHARCGVIALWTTRKM